MVAAVFEPWRQPATRVAVLGPFDAMLGEDSLAALREAGGTLVQHPSFGLEIPDTVADADVVVTNGVGLDAATLRQLRRVRFVLRPYVGYDDIDVPAATPLGILVANVPDTFVEEVANHTLALILALNRKLLATDAFVRRGDWAAGQRPRQFAQPIRRVSSLTLGLVGFGTIARLVAERARPFGFRLLAADPYVEPAVAEAMGVRLIGLDALLAESDIVSVHVFLSPETRGLINAQRLARMRPGAYLVNTARGAIVDQAALVDALRSGHLAGAALDVFEQEPLPASSPLIGLDNVLLTPHLGSYSEEGDERHRARVADILLQVVRGALPERKVVINKDLFDQIAAAAAHPSRVA